jgi:hypothetical protein
VTEIPGLKQVSEAPVVRGVARPILRRFLGGPASVDQTAHQTREDFYRVLGESQQLRNTIRTLMARGETARAQALIRDNPKARRLYAAANQLNQLSTLAGQVRRAGKNEAQALRAMQKIVEIVEGERE